MSDAHQSRALLLLRLSREQLKADLQAAIGQSDPGLSGPLDIAAIQSELIAELDERGQPK
jgi:hypothetical protein